MGKNIFLSFDFDGFWYDQKVPIDVRKDPQRLLTNEANEQRLKQIQDRLLKKNNNAQVVVFAGSNRGGVYPDLVNALEKRKKTCSYFPLIRLIARQLNAELSGLLLQDIFFGSSLGASLDKAGEKTIEEWAQYYSEQLPKQGKKTLDGIMTSKFNASIHRFKIDMIYAQVHHAASLSNDADSNEFHFFDDNLEILQQIHAFYSSHCDLLPSNFCLMLYQGTPANPENLANPTFTIQGNGDKDKDYVNTVRAAMQLHSMGYQEECTNYFVECNGNALTNLEQGETPTNIYFIAMAADYYLQFERQEVTPPIDEINKVAVTFKQLWQGAMLRGGGEDTIKEINWGKLQMIRQELAQNPPVLSHENIEYLFKIATTLKEQGYQESAYVSRVVGYHYFNDKNGLQLKQWVAAAEDDTARANAVIKYIDEFYQRNGDLVWDKLIPLFVGNKLLTQLESKHVQLAVNKDWDTAMDKVRKCADVNIVDPQSNLTILQAALQQGKDAIAQELICEHGANAFAKEQIISSVDSKSPLMYAIENGLYHTVKFLLAELARDDNKPYADWNLNMCADSQGKNLLYYAVTYDARENNSPTGFERSMAKLLVENGTPLGFNFKRAKSQLSMSGIKLEEHIPKGHEQDLGWLMRLIEVPHDNPSASLPLQEAESPSMG